MRPKDTNLLSSTCEPGAFTLHEFSTLYHQYANAVYANIFKLVQHVGDAEDIVQDVFASLWENRFKLHNQSIGGWLFVVSHNKAMDHLKQQLKYSFDPISSCEALPDLTADNKEKEDRYLEQWNMVMEAVEALPPRKKEVFQLCRLEGRSKEEVADMIGISSNSVADYLKQSNKAIKEYIVAHYPYAVSHGVLLLAFSSLH